MARLDNQTIAVLFISFMCMFIFPKIATPEEAAVKERPKRENKVEYKSENLRDPFQEQKIEIKEERKEPEVAKPLPALRVQGIVWGGSLPQAIINNKVMRLGDTVEDVVIKEINRSGVTVLFGGRKYNLTTSTASSSAESVPKIKAKPVKKNP